MATKPVQIDEKMHKRLKRQSINADETMGKLNERYIAEGIKNDKAR